MSWLRGREELQELIRKNRDLRAQAQLASTDIQSLIEQQEELIWQAEQLVAFGALLREPSKVADLCPQREAARKVT